MINSWTEAEKKEYDYYLWLNDDTLLYPSALSELIECTNSEENKKII